MMNDEGPLACGCLVWPQTWTVMVEALGKTVVERCLQVENDDCHELRKVFG